MVPGVRVELTTYVLSKRCSTTELTRRPFRGFPPANGKIFISGFGEMDIISVFETDGVGSIPASPAKQRLTTIVIDNIIESCLTNERKT